MIQVEQSVFCETEVCKSSSIRRLRRYFKKMKGHVLELIKQGFGREEVEEKVDLFPYFPVEKGKEQHTRSFIRRSVERMYNQLIESSLEE